MSTDSYKTENKLNIIIIILLLVILSACGGSTTVGNPGGGVTSVELTGTAQKGPFTEGSTIVIYELNDAFNQTGSSFSTEIINYLGEYTVPVEVRSTFVELFVEGFYFDEISGNFSSAQLSLNALADLSGNDSINVNILTTLSSPRIRYLIKQGATFSSARAQAEDEILTAFGIKTDSISLFEDMTTLAAGESNAVLLAISAIVMQLAHWEEDGAYVPATLSWLISMIKHDIETDGVLDDDSLHTSIQYARSWVNLSQVRENMETRYQAIDPSIVIPRFEDYFLPITMDLLSTHDMGQEIYQSSSWEDTLLAVSPDETRVYMVGGVGYSSNRLLIFNTTTNTIEMEETYDYEIRSLVLNPSGSKLFVIWDVPDSAGADDKAISIFDTTTPQITEISHIPVADAGSGIRKAIIIDDPDPDFAEKVYLADFDIPIIHVLNLRLDGSYDLDPFGEAVGNEMADILFNDSLVDIGVAKGYDRLYFIVESENGETSFGWAEWDVSTGQIGFDSISNEGILYQKILVSPDGGTLYLFCTSSQTVNFQILKYDVDTMKQIDSVEFNRSYNDQEDDDIYPYGGVNDIAISPDGSYICLINLNGFYMPTGFIMVHTPTFSVSYPEGYEATRGDTDERVVIGPDGSKVYVLHYPEDNQELMIFDTGVHY